MHDDGRDDGPGDATPRVGRVVTGGQSGVDRAAVDVAVAHGVAYGGWVPHGGWAEDRPDPPGVLADYPSFSEADSADPAERTARNVSDADATLVLVLGETTSPGTAATLRCCAQGSVPHVVVDLAAHDGGTRLADFVMTLPRGCALNVAGPRESERPGVYAAARAFLEHHAPLLFGPNA